MRIFRGSCSWGGNFTVEETAGKEHGSSDRGGQWQIRYGAGSSMF